IVPLVGDTIAPLFNAESMGYSILAGALVLSVMSIPYILNMLLEVFRQVPVELGEASLSLGATKWETIKHVFIRKGATGILSAFVFGSLLLFVIILVINIFFRYIIYKSEAL